MPRTRIALCYGTRPQVIKASVLRRRLDAGHDVLAMDTGQHYDYELNALLYEQLGVRAPDAILEVGSGGHADQTAAVLVRAEKALQEFRPRAVVVIGDTNSTLGCALAAAKLRMPVVHVEAGLRADDALMPEEINRRVVDAIAHVLCTPSARATRRCQAERHDAAVVETGDVAYDVLRAHADRLPAPPVPAGANRAFCFATVHRAELTDRPDVLRGVLQALASLDRPVLLALHPRTRAALQAAGIEPRFGKGLTVVPPVGYLESLALARSAEMVFTDSGGLQREAYWLGTPCVTLRRETEWQETIDEGANITIDPAGGAAELQRAVTAHRHRWSDGARWSRSAYGEGDAADRIVASLEPLVR
ncbi:MAG TPA: UDP-N-acetylglucosamine 2-epimerase (non-hydrolyzing) [Gemmatimonadales bacterium]|jgi:UDP-N-acetylglucosamine 2-epimerase